MVRTENKQNFASDPWLLLASDKNTTDSKLFQATQASSRFCQLVQTGLRTCGERKINWLDPDQSLFQQTHALTFELHW